MSDPQRSALTEADVQAAKRVVLDFYTALDAASDDQLGAVLRKRTTDDYRWRGVHPFGEHDGADAVTESFWRPLRAAFSPLQRRPDVFLAGRNDPTVEHGDPDAVWVCQMGHLLGLFDHAFLDIPPTRRMCFVRYVDFHRVDGSQIAETTTHIDVIGIMTQAGYYPLPPQTGASHIDPGPRTHDGLLFEPQDAAEGVTTLALVDRMIETLHLANADTENRMSREVLAETWHDDMIWAGPEGIGATYTIDRYQQQHQYPFRMNLSGKRFNGHVARFAEGDYACFFGWANLTNKADGGFLGLTESRSPADMRVVDVYRRDGDKLAENWVFIDLPHWLEMQGLDVLARMRQLIGVEEL